MNTQDWGTNTLRRYRYQAEVAVPYCIAAAAGLDGIQAVVPEHHDDVALDCGTSWRYLQVKSRNLDLGLWTLSQLLRPGGALRALFRTHKCVGSQEHVLELLLEGAPKSRDPIMTLLPGEDRSGIVRPVADALRTTEASAAEFLDRVVLNGPPAPRDVISAQNRDLLHSQAPHLTHPEVDSLHQRVVNEIERAMRADRMGALWPRAVAHPALRSSEMSARFEAKRLSREALRDLLEPVTAEPRPLLRRLTESGSRTITSLHRKMMQGGADPKTIEHARNLQANVRHEHLTRSAQGRPVEQALLDDLHQRIETHAYSRVSIHSSAPRPAPRIWADLVELFESKASSIDHSRVLRQDPMLLLGEACDLSDACRFGWGVVADEA